ncbi:hypothetical protein [Stygiolobus caldivivus]|uniref:Uncharacterized protein n=1 Tax=Stygiolobus caldivivus TaxID=2824673 RepID=A0A8D5U6N3_9CREN|nr:hypothetical protein [Stygiolobus caldivivus]BCU69816.1 hypothetical protein KN1_11130 [Stygiolobus caldivivus]
MNKLKRVFSANRDLSIIPTKGDLVMLELTAFAIILSLLDYRLVFLDVVAILGYYFMPKYGYDGSGIWRLIGNKRRLYFMWKDVRELVLNKDTLYFLLNDGKVVKISGVRDPYRVYLKLKKYLT